MSLPSSNISSIRDRLATLFTQQFSMNGKTERVFFFAEVHLYLNRGRIGSRPVRVSHNKSREGKGEKPNKVESSFDID